MNEIANISKLVWGINIAVECLLFLSILFSRNYREYPVFFFYISASLLQSLGLLICYRIWGFDSFASWAIAWTTQVVVMTARALAVAEICHRLFERYRGVWELIRRILLGIAAIVLLYSVIVSRHNRFLIMPNIQRGLDLAIATGLVGSFLFARYYRVPPSPVLGTLALGFLLFCSFAVLNATVLERYTKSYAPLWTLLQMVSFLASVVMWTRGMWQPQVSVKRTPLLTSNDLYRTLAPDVNLKLRLLNDQLSRFWKVEVDRN